MEPKKSLNPSIEDLQEIANKELARSVAKFSEESYQNKIQETKDGLVLKPKLSTFEPEPVLFALPTGNILHRKFPKAVTPDGEIMVRRISAFEEIYIDQFFNASEEQISNLITNIIEGCIKSDIPVTEIHLLDKIPLFFFVIAISYGSLLNVAPIEGCKTCIPGETRVEIDYLKDINIKRFPKDLDYPRKAELKTYPNMRLTAHVVMPIIRDEKDLVKTPTNREDLIIKLRAIISSITGYQINTGEEVRSNQINELLAFLDSDDKERIKNAIDDITTSYGIDYEVMVKNCSQEKCSKIGQKVTLSLQDLLMAFLMNSKQPNDR